MHPLGQRIDQLRRRRQSRRWCAAVGWVVAAAVGVSAAVMVGDYVLRSPDRGLRWLALLSVVAAVGIAAWRRLTPVWRRPETTAGVAHAVQQRFPSLGSRLASALEFLHQPPEDAQAGSADLRRAVVVETTSEVDDLAIEEIDDPLPMRRAIVSAVGAVLAIGLFALVDPAGLSIAATRLTQPWTDVDWPRRNRLSVTDAPERLARGQSFEATIVDNNGELPADARILYRSKAGGSERIDEQPLQVVGEQGFAERENVQRGFDYRVVGGDDLSMAWRRVEVVDPPTADIIAVTAQSPVYSGLPGGAVGPDIRVLTGTRLELVGSSDAPLATAVVEIQTRDETAWVEAVVKRRPEGGVSVATPADRWIAAAEGDEVQSSTYSVRLTTDDGLVGQTPPRVLRVEPDPAPTIDWVAPASDVFVTAQAVVPIEAAAHDNLAIRWVDLVVRSANPPAPDAADPAAGRDAEPLVRERLHDGPEQPPLRADGLATLGESIQGKLEWSLDGLALEVGSQLVLAVESADYRPGIGVTPVTRRVTIISLEELESRIADAAAGLARDLERSLAQQRATREGVERLAIDRRNGQPVDRATVDRLATIAYEQREVADAVADDERGAARQAEQLLQEIKNNRLERPDLSERLADVAGGLRELASEPLPAAERGLADARRASERRLDLDDDPSEAADQAEAEIDSSLNAALGSQDNAIEKLESLVDSLGRWSDVQRFTREAAELERRERELAADTRRAAADQARGPQSESEKRAEREKLAAAQAELGRRFDRLRQAIRDQVGQSDAPTETTQPLADALAESEENATGGKMSDAARQLAAGRMGRAAEQQEAAAEDLKQMLETLRNQASRDPRQLAEQLRDAQKRLEELREQVAEETQSPADGGQPERREQLGERTQRLARRLDRLDAPQAGESTQQGGEQMNQSAQQSQSNQLRSQQSMRQADQDLEQAERQLAERLEQLEDQIAESVLQKLAAKIDGYVDRQRQVLEGTVLADDTITPDRGETTLALGVDQRALEAEIAAAARELASRAVFEQALGGAAAEMDAAASRLEGRDPGLRTQRREHAALTRLRHVAEVLKPGEQEPDEGENEQPSPPPGGQGGQPPQPPPIAVAELKMLRLMQLDLNARTRQFEADAAEGLIPRAEGREAAERLAAEQSRLVELVRELAARNNEGTGDDPPPADE